MVHQPMEHIQAEQMGVEFTYFEILVQQIGLDLLLLLQRFNFLSGKWMEPSRVEDKGLQHLSSVGLPVRHPLQVDEMVVMQHTGRNGRGGRVPIVEGHPGQRDALHLSVDIEFGDLNPIIDIEQVVKSQVNKRHHAFNRVLENPGHQCAKNAKDNEIARFFLDFDDA